MDSVDTWVKKNPALFQTQSPEIYIFLALQREKQESCDQLKPIGHTMNVIAFCTTNDFHLSRF